MASVAKEALLKIVGDDTDAEEKLDKITAKADELRAANPTLTVRIDTAEATAKMAVFREELKAATKTMTADVDAQTSGGKVGLLERLLFGEAGSGGGGAGGPGLGGLAGATEGLSPGMLIGVAAAVPAVFALLTEVTGLVSGITAAAAGIGAFGLLALPTLDGIKNAYTAIGTAQQKVATAQTAYNDAVEKQKLDPTKANATAAATALLNLKVAQEDLAKTSPKYQSVITGIQGVIAEFKEFAKPLQPVVLTLVNDALNTAAALLPYVAQLAGAASKPIEEVMGALSKSVTSNGFSDFIDKLSKISGPAIEAIGAGVIKTGEALGKLLTVMSAHDVVHTINIAFDVLAGTINVLTGIVSRLMSNWDDLSAHAQSVAHTVVQNWNDMLHWFEGLPGSFAQVIRNIENWWDDLVHDAGGIPGRVVAALAGLPGMLYNAGASAVQRLIDGLLSKIGSLGSAAGELAKKVAGFFGLSPAVEGPLSGPGAPEIRGRHFADAFASGMSNGVSSVGAVAGRLGNAAAGVAGSTGRGAPQVVLQFQGGDSQTGQFVAMILRQYVHAVGGGGPNSVQIALGQNR